MARNRSFMLTNERLMHFAVLMVPLPEKFGFGDKSGGKSRALADDHETLYPLGAQSLRIYI